MDETLIIKARREYQRLWREKNHDKIIEYQKRFFEKQARKLFDLKEENELSDEQQEN